MVGVALCALLPEAKADSESADSPALGSAPLAMPDLATPRRMTAEVAILSWDAAARITIVTFDLSGQYEVGPGVLVFARLPLSHVDDGERAESDLGNLSFGSRYVARGGALTVSGSLAVSLATAPEFDFVGENGMAAFIASTARFSTYGRYAGGVFGTYLASDLRYEHPRFFVQGQLGYEKYVDSGVPDDLDVLRFSLAGGVKLARRLTVISEVTSISHILDTDHYSDTTHHWLELGGRVRAGKASLGAWLYWPIDHPISDVDSAYPVWGVCLDVGVAL